MATEEAAGLIVVIGLRTEINPLGLVDGRIVNGLLGTLGCGALCRGQVHGRALHARNRNGAGHRLCLGLGDSRLLNRDGSRRAIDRRLTPHARSDEHRGRIRIGSIFGEGGNTGTLGRDAGSLNEDAGVICGELLFGTVDSWLIWKLTGGMAHVTDYTNASRTMLFDIHRLCWDEELLKLLDIPACMLPEVRPSSQVYGWSSYELFGGEIPVAGAAGDQQSALFGQCCFEPGDMKNTYGTGCFLLMNTGSEPVESKNGLITTIAATLPGQVQYALEGSVFTGGAAVQWLRDELGVISSAAESLEYAESVPDTAGVYVVPAFTGLGAPYWNQYARGMITGVTRGFSRAHLVRATLESIAYQTCDICEAMERDAGVPLTQLKVDGGASANNFLMQFQADILSSEVVRPKCIETTAMGAAYLAGLAVGFWQGLDDVRASWETEKVFAPEMPAPQRESLLKGWQKAIKSALAWTED